MIDLLIYNRSRQVLEKVSASARDMVAFMSDDKLRCAGYDKAEKLCSHLDKDKPYDLSVLEISNDADVGISERVRAERIDSEMMLIADSRMSPMKYMTPDIRACSLLLSPYDEQSLKSVMKDFISSYIRKRITPDDHNSIVIENRSGKTVLQYSQIYFIEARNKKVYFRLRDREYSKYDTLENVKKKLPPTFVQSHRSFIFNTEFLERIKISEKTVYLSHDIPVPLSRSYSSSVKEFLSGLSGS